MSELVGVVILVVGGFCGGIFTTLLPFSRWAWESKWGLFALQSYAIMPWVAAAIFVPHLGAALEVTKTHVLVEVAVFGLLWGVGSVLFGVGVNAVGNSLGFALILGLTATLGSVIPLLVFHIDEVGSAQGLCNWIALALTIIGLALCGKAGALKEKGLAEMFDEDIYQFVQSNSSSRETSRGVSRSGSESRLLSGMSESDSENVLNTSSAMPESTMSLGAGVTVCLLSGVLSSCLNLAVTFGEALTDAAKDTGGAHEVMASTAVAAVGVSCGSLPSLLYCTWLCYSNGTYTEFFCCAERDFEPDGDDDVAFRPKAGSALPTHILWPWSVFVCFCMAILWFVGFVMYGVGASLMGDLGLVVGWPVYINTMVLTGNVSGVITGEWAGTSNEARCWMAGGVGILVGSIIVVGIGNSF